MIKYSEGTVFNVGTQAIVNTVNCTGVMGAGIALEFKLRYPDMFNDYESKCKNKRIVTGSVDFFKADNGMIIVNFPTKWHFKYPSKLEWIDQGLNDFLISYKKQGITSVAFPKLGTSNGGLNWKDVRKLMEKYLSKADIDIYICLDQKGEAEGIEKIMLDKFNTTSIDQLACHIKLSDKQKIHIQNKIPYDRFWKISETELIGTKTYSSIFQYFYKLECEIKEVPMQISMFD